MDLLIESAAEVWEHVREFTALVNIAEDELSQVWSRQILLGTVEVVQEMLDQPWLVLCVVHQSSGLIVVEGGVLASEFIVRQIAVVSRYSLLAFPYHHWLNNVGGPPSGLPDEIERHLAMEPGAEGLDVIRHYSHSALEGDVCGDGRQDSTIERGSDSPGDRVAKADDDTCFGQDRAGNFYGGIGSLGELLLPVADLPPLDLALLGVGPDVAEPIRVIASRVDQFMVDDRVGKDVLDDHKSGPKLRVENWRVSIADGFKILAKVCHLCNLSGYPFSVVKVPGPVGLDLLGVTGGSAVGCGALVGGVNHACHSH